MEQIIAEINREYPGWIIQKMMQKPLSAAQKAINGRMPPGFQVTVEKKGDCLIVEPVQKELQYLN